MKKSRSTKSDNITPNVPRDLPGSTGIRILDKKSGAPSTRLSNILKAIDTGDQYSWAILYSTAIGDLGTDKSIPSFEDEISKKRNGLVINWNNLNDLSNRFFQVISILIIGCKNTKFLHRYETDREMYNTCDFVIETVDSSYWEVFCKNDATLANMASQFKEVEFLSSF